MAGALDGRTLLVTGASRGIGAAIAAELVTQGARVVAHFGSHREGAEAAVAAAADGAGHVLGADLSVPGSADALWAQAVAWSGRIDGVVVNAAVMPDTPLTGDDAGWDEGWELALRVNVLAPARLIRAALAHFLEHDGGTLVTLSSWAAQRGSALPDLGAYAATKAAIRSLTQTVARAHARDGVRAYVVAPGIVRTRMSDVSATARGGVEAMNATLAMGERVEPDEVARLVAFLASDAAPNLTGATLDVNGASYIR